MIKIKNFRNSKYVLPYLCNYISIDIQHNLRTNKRKLFWIISKNLEERYSM